MSHFQRKTEKATINKKIEDLNKIIVPLDLIDIYRALYPTKEYTFISRTHGTFSRINNILSYKIHFKFKKDKN